MLAGEGRRPPVELAPLAPGGKIQWDPAAAGPQPAEPGEASAYDTLARSLGATDARRLTVTGPLQSNRQPGTGCRCAWLSSEPAPRWLPVSAIRRCL